MYPGASTAGPGEALAAFPRATRGAFLALGFRTRVPRGEVGGAAHEALSAAPHGAALRGRRSAGGTRAWPRPLRPRRGKEDSGRPRHRGREAPERGRLPPLSSPLPLPVGRGGGLCPLGAAPERGGGRCGRPCPRLCATCRPPSPRRARLFCQLGLLPAAPRCPRGLHFQAPIRRAVLRRPGAGVRGEPRPSRLVSLFRWG